MPNGNNKLIGFGTNTPATATANYYSSYANLQLGTPAPNPPTTPVSGTTIVSVTVNYTYNTLVIGALINLLTFPNGSFSTSLPMSATSNMICE